MIENGLHSNHHIGQSFKDDKKLGKEVGLPASFILSRFLETTWSV